MKKQCIQTALLLLALVFVSCEKEVIVDVETATARLVINAPLVWPKGTTGNYQKIQLSLTTSYYSTNTPKVTNANVTVTDELGNVFVFTQEDEPGTYECHNFIPVLNRKYFLEVFYNGETYRGTETLYGVTDFDQTTQSNNGGINSDEIEVKAYFTDPANVPNYYLSQRKSPIKAIPEYTSFSDQFFDGNQVFDVFNDEDLKPTNTVTFTLYGVSKQHQEYLFKILNASSGNPFQPIPGVVKGNMINTTTNKNYPLGYFSVSQTATITHTIQ